MKHLKKLTALTLATLLAFTCYVGYQQVSAEDANAGDHFYVANTSDSNSYYGLSHNSGVITISESGDYTIEKACTCENAYVHEDYQIVIEGVLTVELTINNVNITKDNAAAMDIDGSSTVTLILEGDNSFTSTKSGTYTSLYGFAGIQYENATTASLTITSDTDGTLSATGSAWGAGIGSGYTYSVSEAMSTDDVVASNITISGGTVYAECGGGGAAGIGGGRYSTAIDITITGGNITAISNGEGASAIGSGANSEKDATVSINSSSYNWRTLSTEAYACSTDGSDVDYTGTYIEILESTGCLVQETGESVIIVDTSTK